MSNYTKTIDWLNKQYQAYPLNIQANRTTLMNHLWMLLKVSLGCDYKVDDNNEQFINQLNMVVQKLFTGWSHPCISLFKIAMNVQLNANEDYTDDTYDGDFGDQLCQSQIEMGIDATSAYFISQIKRLFSVEALQYNNNLGDAGIREIAHRLNHYFANDKPELAKKYGLVRSDGCGSFENYANHMAIYWQSRNNEPLTGEVKLPNDFTYDDSKYHITDPIQYAFYLRGLTSLIGWTGYENYRDDVINYQRLLNDEINKYTLSNQEIEILFKKDSLQNVISSLTILRNVKRGLRKSLSKTDLDLSYSKEYDLGDSAIVTPAGLILGMKVRLLQNRDAYTAMDNDYDHPHKLSLSYSKDFTSGIVPIKDGSLNFSTTTGYKSDLLTTAFSPTKPILESFSVKNGAMKLTINTDLTTNTLNFVYSLQINSVKDPRFNKKDSVVKVSMSTVVQITLYVTFAHLIDYLAKTPDRAFVQLKNSLDEVATKGLSLALVAVTIKLFDVFGTAMEPSWLELTALFKGGAIAVADSVSAIIVKIPLPEFLDTLNSGGQA